MEEENYEEEGLGVGEEIEIIPGFEISTEEYLKKLEEDPILLLKILLASHKNLPKELQEKFAEEDILVRAKLSVNPSLNKEVMEKLAKDEDVRIRKVIA
ncbi:MAG: hypothetical protein ACP5FX_01690, partial [Candidatus Micrarchaeia archaeon]